MKEGQKKKTGMIKNQRIYQGGDGLYCMDGDAGIGEVGGEEAGGREIAFPHESQKPALLSFNLAH